MRLTSLLAAALAAPSALALSISGPSSSAFWVANTSNVITWTSNASDPATVDIIVVNSNASTLNGAFSIANAVSVTSQTFTVTNVTLRVGSGYAVEFVNPDNTSQVLATSDTFSVMPGGSTPRPARKRLLLGIRRRRRVLLRVRRELGLRVRLERSLQLRLRRGREHHDQRRPRRAPRARCGSSGRARRRRGGALSPVDAWILVKSVPGKEGRRLGLVAAGPFLVQMVSERLHARGRAARRSFCPARSLWF
ncbi:hypothetical protein CERSUDRAFT_116430 [Gelatoporia subvermispora B]|uniref:Yeast cell wall synthesis Kre9/Knh1-like N-terminal domain-containing protein n=1 Tax=Ceriporiopsis subvermispora (strain B) TaxID=914234 RepID=M2QCY5_CERS8|nr:hypothetical protein CERSUDRAFT_116430 [Gelatoporia subvermispora B]